MVGYYEYDPAIIGGQLLFLAILFGLIYAAVKKSGGGGDDNYGT